MVVSVSRWAPGDGDPVRAPTLAVAPGLVAGGGDGLVPVDSGPRQRRPELRFPTLRADFPGLALALHIPVERALHRLPLGLDTDGLAGDPRVGRAAGGVRLLGAGQQGVGADRRSHLRPPQREAKNSGEGDREAERRHARVRPGQRRERKAGEAASRRGGEPRPLFQPLGEGFAGPVAQPIRRRRVLSRGGFAVESQHAIGARAFKVLLAEAAVAAAAQVAARRQALERRQFAAE